MKKRSAQSTSESTKVGIHSVRSELFLEGRSKSYYKTDKPEYIIQKFNDDTKGEKKQAKNLKLSSLKNNISCYLFEHLENFHIPTHYISKISDNEMMVRKLDMLPIILRVSNYVTSTIAKQFGFKEGILLNFPIFEHFVRGKNRVLVWINEYHLSAMKIATLDEYRQMNRIASKVNAVLRGLCERRKLKLAQIQLEFGYSKGQIFLGDELCPPSILFWDADAESKSDREKYTEDNDDVIENFTDLFNRLYGKS